MFAILLSDKMNPFYQNIGSFPTVFFTFFLLLCVLYWLVAVLGFVEIDALDFDLPEADSNLGLDGDMELSNPDVLAGLMMKLGLYGVPVTLIVSFISLIGWFLSYYIVYFLEPLMPDNFIRYLIGLPILLGSLFVAVIMTGQLIKPIRTFFKKTQQDTLKYITGQIAVVRTSRVDSNFGEANLEDGGAGLIIKVRALGDETFAKGDRVALLEYVENENVYRVVSEEEFLKN